MIKNVYVVSMLINCKKLYDKSYNIAHLCVSISYHWYLFDDTKRSFYKTFITNPSWANYAIAVDGILESLIIQFSVIFILDGTKFVFNGYYKHLEFYIVQVCAGSMSLDTLMRKL